MRILQIVHSVPYYIQAGVEIYTYNLCRELAKKNQVFIFSRISDLGQKEYALTKKDNQNLTLYFINNTFRACSSFSEYENNNCVDKVFEDLIEEINPDVVHIQHLVFLSTGLIKVIKKKDIPILFTLHDYWLMCPKWHLLKADWSICEKAISGKYDNECLDCLASIINMTKNSARLYYTAKKLLPEFLVVFLRKIYLSRCKGLKNTNDCIKMLQERTRKIKQCLEDVDVFLSPSEYLRNMFVTFGIPAEKIMVSRQGVNNGLIYRAEVRGNNGKIRFGFIGTILPAKGLHILIKAFNGVKNDFIELKIYGKMRSYSGYEDYLPYLRKISKHNKNIQFLGEFENEDICSILNNIDVLVVPSIWPENSPLVIQEAFLAKIPVIASKIGGIPELINDWVNGLLFNPGDAVDLRKKIEYIMNNPDMLGMIKGNMHVAESIEDDAQELESIYTKATILKQGRAAMTAVTL